MGEEKKRRGIRVAGKGGSSIKDWDFSLSPKHEKILIAIIEKAAKENAQEVLNETLSGETVSYLETDGENIAVSMAIQGAYSKDFLYLIDFDKLVDGDISMAGADLWRDEDKKKILMWRDKFRAAADRIDAALAEADAKMKRGE